MTSEVVGHRARVAQLVRELAFPVLAVVAIAATADVRIPVGLPGHRGLIWLTLLVAVALSVRRAGVVAAVGAVSTLLSAVLGAPDLRYLAAALLLDAVLAVPAVRRHPVLLVLAAAPIHLVALIGPVASGPGPGLLKQVLFHLGFGLVAGLLGWALAALVTRSGATRR